MVPHSVDNLLTSDYDIIKSGLIGLYNDQHLYARLVEGKGFVGNAGNISETLPEIGYFRNTDLLVDELHRMVDLRLQYDTLDSCVASPEFISTFSPKLIPTKNKE